MTFAFVVHALHRRDYLRGSFAQSTLPRALRNRPFQYAVVYLMPRRARNYLKSFFREQIVFTYPSLTSATGVRVRGEVVGIPMVSEELVAEQSRGVAILERVCARLAARGVGVIGLGGINGVIGSYGRAVAQRSAVPLTTGASYTVYAALQTLWRMAEWLGRAPSGLRVVLVGFPGRNARALATLLARRGVELAIVAEPNAPSLRALVGALARSGRVTVLPREGCFARLRPSDILVGASSTGDQIDERLLPPGTMVIDVSLPRDVMHASRRRDDVLVVDGEVVRLPPGCDGVEDFFGCGEGHVLACFAETCVLAMEGRTDSFTIGRDIVPEKVEEIGDLAQKHGFAVDRLYALGRPVSRERFDRVRSLAERRLPARRVARADGQIQLPAAGRHEGTADGNG